MPVCGVAAGLAAGGRCGGNRSVKLPIGGRNRVGEGAALQKCLATAVSSAVSGMGFAM
jgi:hypothetical protein